MSRQAHTYFILCGAKYNINVSNIVDTQELMAKLLKNLDFNVN